MTFLYCKAHFKNSHGQISASTILRHDLNGTKSGGLIRIFHSARYATLVLDGKNVVIEVPRRLVPTVWASILAMTPGSDMLGVCYITNKAAGVTSLFNRENLSLLQFHEEHIESGDAMVFWGDTLEHDIPSIAQLKVGYHAGGIPVTIPHNPEFKIHKTAGMVRKWIDFSISIPPVICNEVSRHSDPVIKKLIIRTDDVIKSMELPRRFNHAKTTVRRSINFCRHIVLRRNTIP